MDTTNLLTEDTAATQTNENEHYQAGFVAVIGRPNVGKSTLMNTMLGQKLSITSHRPQTTRHRIHGIHTNEIRQIVYVDTPGMHLTEGKSLNRYMNRAANSAFGDVDVILFVVEAGRWTREDQAVADKCKTADTPVIILINKIDNFKNKEDLFPFLKKVSENAEFTTVIPVSAYKNSGIDIIEAEVMKHIPTQAMLFPEDYITDRSSRFLASEIVREKLMRTMGEEVPYGATVEIEKYSYEEGDVNPKTGQKKEGRWVINALILVERSGQKKIIIGSKGEQIKQMGIQARKDLITMLDARVHLELWVKVKSNWSDDERALASLGYTEDHTG